MELLGVPMLDGIKMGLCVDPKQMANLARAFEAYAGGPTRCIEVKALTVANVVLNTHNNVHWLNISCNPISFISGQNVFGTCDDQLIVDVWERVDSEVLTTTGKPLLDKDMRARIRERLINVYSIAFASYTKKIPQKVQPHLLSYTNVLYTHPLSSEGLHINAKASLGLTIDQGLSGYSLTFTKIRGSHKVWRLCLYNKVIELEQTGKPVPIDALRDSLRLDLTLSSQWIYSNTRNSDTKCMLKALLPLDDLAKAQLSAVILATNLRAIAQPFSVDVDVVARWASSKLTREDEQSLKALGYRTDFRPQFYQALDFIKSNIPDGVRRTIDDTAWSKYVQRFINNLVPVSKDMATADLTPL